MPHGGPPSENISATQGLVGGPGPTPEGFDDGTNVTIPTPEPLPSKEAQKEAGEVAERSAGTRGAEVPGQQRKEPEED